MVINVRSDTVHWLNRHVDGLVQDCSIYIANLSMWDYIEPSIFTVSYMFIYI